MNKYPKISRIESAIITEKIDGSNFSWKVDNDNLKFYSRNKEVSLDNKNDNFYHPFIKFINDKHKYLNFLPNHIFYAEILGQAQIKYFDKHEDISIKNLLYIFDIFNNINQYFLRWELVKNQCEIQEINHVPETTFNEIKSKINSNVNREGIVLIYETKYLDEETNNIFYRNTKLKLVERKNHGGKEYPQYLEIKQLKPFYFEIGNKINTKDKNE